MTETRVLPLKGAENVRELGGYQTIDGKKVRFHKILRGDSLAELTAEDIKYLQEYGLTTIVDFRSAEEQESAPDVVIPGVKHISLPVFDENSKTASASPQGLAKELTADDLDGKTLMENLYQSFITDSHSVAAYGKFFEILLANNQEDHAVLFHCTAGKDRTGFGAALFLSAVGVDRETILQDYELTNQHLNHLKEMMASEAEKNHIPASMMKNGEAVLSADPAYLNAAFHALEKNYGSVGNFLVEALGFDGLAQDDLRELYID